MQRMKCYYLSRCKLGLEWFAAKIAIRGQFLLWNRERAVALGPKGDRLGRGAPFWQALGACFLWPA